MNSRQVTIQMDDHPLDVVEKIREALVPLCFTLEEIQPEEFPTGVDEMTFEVKYDPGMDEYAWGGGYY